MNYYFYYCHLLGAYSNLDRLALMWPFKQVKAAQIVDKRLESNNKGKSLGEPFTQWPEENCTFLDNHQAKQLLSTIREATLFLFITQASLKIVSL